jgi:uncharacterized BrkB/YihY/UPF0761 family membrane protein
MPTKTQITETTMGQLFTILVLAMIVGSLFTALHRLTQRKETSSSVVKALTVRISLSIALFIALLLSYQFGLISPSGLR